MDLGDWYQPVTTGETGSLVSSDAPDLDDSKSGPRSQSKAPQVFSLRPAVPAEYKETVS